jgi:hypothetical protein
MGLACEKNVNSYSETLWCAISVLPEILHDTYENGDQKPHRIGSEQVSTKSNLVERGDAAICRSLEREWWVFLGFVFSCQRGGPGSSPVSCSR